MNIRLFVRLWSFDSMQIIKNSKATRDYLKYNIWTFKEPKYHGYLFTNNQLPLLGERRKLILLTPWQFRRARSWRTMPSDNSARTPNILSLWIHSWFSLTPLLLVPVPTNRCRDAEHYLVLPSQNVATEQEGLNLINKCRFLNNVWFTCEKALWGMVLTKKKIYIYIYIARKKINFL